MPTTTQVFAASVPVPTYSPNTTAWTNPSNATGSNTSTPTATFTTTTSGQVGWIQVGGFALSPASLPVINSVLVQVWSYVAATARWSSSTAQLFDSSGVAIGAAQTLTLSATTTNTQTLTFTGVTKAQLTAGIFVRVSATKTGTQSSTFNVNAVGVSIDYSQNSVPFSTGFDTDASGFAATAPSTILYSASGGRTGAASVDLYYSGSNATAQAVQTFTGFTIGNRYTVSIWVKNEGTTATETAGLGVTGLSFTSATITSSSVHTQLSYTFFATATSHEIYFQTTSTGSLGAYFDDFVLDLSLTFVPYSTGFEASGTPGLSGFVADAGSTIATTSTANSRTGTYCLNLFFNGTGTGRLSQSFNGFVIGQVYTASLWVQQATSPATETMTLGVTGMSSVSVTPTGTAYSLLKFSFVATAIIHEIYATTTTTSSNGALFDDFSVGDYVPGGVNYTTIVARTGTTNDSGVTLTTSVILTKPTDAVAGDIAIASFSTNGTAVSGVPSGWTLLGSISVPNPRVYVYYRILDSSDTGITTYTWTIASSVWGGNMQAFNGVDPTTPMDVTPVTMIDNVASQTSFSISINNVTEGAMLVSSLGANTAAGVNSTAPTGWTRDPAGATAFTNGKANSLAHLLRTTAGYNTYTWTINSGRAGGIVIGALRPAPATVGGATGDVKVGTGAAFSAKPAKYYSGGVWGVKPVKYEKAGAYTVTPY